MTRSIAAALFLAAIGGCGGPSPVDTGPDAALLFLVQRSQPDAVMEALFQGRVEVDQAGCFRLDTNADGATIVWPFGSTLARDEASLVVLDDQGRTLVRVGDNVRLGGGFVNDLAQLDVLVPEMLAAALARCPGSYWIVGEVLPPLPRESYEPADGVRPAPIRRWAHWRDLRTRPMRSPDATRIDHTQRLALQKRPGPALLFHETAGAPKRRAP